MVTLSMLTSTTLFAHLPRGPRSHDAAQVRKQPDALWERWSGGSSLVRLSCDPPQPAERDESFPAAAYVLLSWQSQKISANTNVD